MAGNPLNPVETTLDQLDQDPQTPVVPPPPQAPAPKPAATPTADDYASLFREQAAGDNLRIRKSLVDAQASAPDRAANIVRLSDATGLPADVVSRNYDAIAARTKLEQLPVDAMRTQTPALASVLAENPHVAAAVHDDLANLGFLEWLVKAPVRAWQTGQAGITAAELHYASIYRDLTPAEQQQLEAADKTAQEAGPLGVGDSWFKGAVVGAAEAMPMLFGAELEGFRYGVPAGITAGVGAAIATAAPVITIEAEPITVPAAFGTGYAAGNTAGVLNYMTRISAGDAMKEFAQFRDETGRPLDPSVQRAAALATGVLNGGLQTVGLAYLLKSIPGLGSLTGKAASNAVKQALRQPSVRAAMRSAMGEYGKTLTVTTSVQAGARAVQILAGELAKAVPKPGSAPGMLEPGNINLFEQPAVENPDGTVSTVDSVSANVDGREVLLSRVTPDGRHLTTEQAIAEFRQTGQNLGTFDSPASADAFAEQLHNDYAAGKYAGMGKFRTSEDIANDLGRATLSAAQAFALISAVGPGIGFTVDAARARRAQGNATFFQALGEGVKQSKTYERLPAALQAVIERATENGPIKTLFTPVDTWTTYWQSKNVDPREMATEVTGDSDAYDRAVREKADLEIPTSRYAAKLAATEHNQFFQNELRLGIDEMNGREATVFSELLKDQDVRARAAEEARTPEGKQIRETLAASLRAANVEPSTADTYAALYESAFTTLAERAGVDPIDLFAKYGLRISREPAPPAEGGSGPGPGGPAGPASAPPAARSRPGESVDPGLPLEPRPTGAGDALRPSDALPRPTPGDAGEGARAVDLGTRAAMGDLSSQPEGVTLGPGGEPTPAASTEGARLTGANPRARAGVPGGAAEPLAADTGGPSGEAGGAARPAAGRTVAIPVAHAAHFEQLLAGARARGFDGTDDELATAFNEVRTRAVQAAKDLNDFEAAEQTTHLDLLRIIAKAGGLGVEAEGGSSEYSPTTGRLLGNGGMVQELEGLLEGLSKVKTGKRVIKRGKRAGLEVEVPIQFRKVGKLPGLGTIITRKGGMTLDTMLEHVTQHEGFEHTFENLSDFLSAVSDAILIELGVMKAPETRGYDVESIMSGAFGVEPGTDWWKPAEPVVDETTLERPIDEGDTSFNIDEFNQGPRPARAQGDLLSTGEVQPRLPGDVGDVRDQEVQQPALGTLVDDFQLTAPEETQPKQTTLFQTVYHGTRHLFEQFSLHAIGTGEGNQAYGWGLYFASKREVADSYRKAHAGVPTGPRLEVDGTPLFDREIGEYYVKWRTEPDGVRVATSDPQTPDMQRGILELQARMSYFKPELPGLTARIRGELEKSIANMSERVARNDPNDTFSGSLERDRYDLETNEAALRALTALGDTFKWGKGEKPGRTYKVEIPEDDQYLDWDRRASQQSPKVKAALEALGVKWTPLEVPTPAQALRMFQSARVLEAAHEDVGTRASLREGFHYAQRAQELRDETPRSKKSAKYEAAKKAADDALRAFEHWYSHNQGVMTGRGQADPVGENLYAEIQRQLAVKHHDEAMKAGGPYNPPSWRSFAEQASKALAAQGLAGIRYLDGASRDAGEGSSNYVVFDDKLARVVEYDQSPLVVQHNLTAANLRHVLKLGGIPVPSLAIARAADTSTNFGEITLLGDKAMADPRGYARTKVFGSDVYSPRYPTVEHKIGEAGQQRLGAIIKARAGETGRNYFDLEQLQRDGPRYLGNEGGVMAEFMASKGIDRPAPVMDTRHGNGTRIDASDTERALSRAIDDAGLRDEYAGYVDKLFNSLEPTERIFKGFTEQGNRRYIPHTLENVVRELKRGLRGGESNGNLYGVGQLRAKFTPEFKSIKAIRAAGDKLLSKADFEKVKEEVTSTFFELGKDLGVYYPHEQGFRYSDTVMAVIEDTPRMGLDRALAEYGFSDVSDEVKASVREFIGKLRDMPTEYFEAKILRDVDLAEFAAAVVPHDVAPELRAALEARGVKVHDYPAGDAEARKRVVNETATRYADRVLFSETPKFRRGAIRFGPDRQFTIALFEHADLSTFLHETGHLYLEVFGDVVDALRGKASEDLSDQQRQLLTDYGTILEHLGVTDRKDIGREQHERFARSFEAYLMSGTAPSIALEAPFARFRAWLTGVYRSVSTLNVNISPEVRDVFDRLLAGDQAIKDAEARAKLEPMFLTAEGAGMDADEFELYKATVARASQTARSLLDAKLMAEVQREQEGEWKRRRGEIEDAVTTELEGQPVYGALAAMRYGTHANGEPLTEGLETEPLKLSRKIILERYGKDRLEALPKPYVYTRDGGMDPDVVATMFGFSSGDELLSAVTQARPLEEAINAETEKRMLAENGSILLDGTLAEKARAALANDDREQIVKSELRALGKLRRLAKPIADAAVRTALAGERAERAYERRWFEAEAKLRVAVAKKAKQEVIDGLKAEVSNLRAKARGGAATIRAAIPPDAVLRENARARIGATRIRNLSPDTFWSLSRRAAQRAIEAAARQDLEGAITAKQEELLNLAMFRAASSAKADIEARVKAAYELTKPAARSRLGLAGDAYLEQVDALLEQYSFTRQTEKALNRRQSLLRFIEQQERENIPIEINDTILEDAQRTPYQEMTYDHLVGVTDALASILHGARLKNRLLKSADWRDFTTMRDTVTDSIRANNAARKPNLEFTAKDDRSRAVSDWFASHAKIAYIARSLDGYLQGGPLWEAFVRPLNEAVDAKNARHTEAYRAIKGLVDRAYPGADLGTLKDRVFIPALGDSMTKEGRLAVALNMGNETSRDRLLHDPVRKFTQAQLDAILGTLDARDARFVQDVWDHIDTYWADIAALQKRVTGLEPVKVEASPIVIAGQELKGGYYPLKYDSRLAPRVSGLETASNAKLITAAAYVRTTTQQGHTETRRAHVSLPLRLDLGVAFEHLEQVIHDLTHRETLIDLSRLVRDREFTKAVVETQGDIVYRQFTKMLEDVALGRKPSRTVFDKAINYVRTGTQLSQLAFNAWTGTKHFTGIFRGAQYVGPTWVARGMARWMRDAGSFENTQTWIREVSPFMRERFSNATEDVAELRAEFQKAGGYVDTIVRKVTADKVTQQNLVNALLWHISTMQRVADIPTWLGAYEKAMAGEGGNEARAIALADQAVRDTQPTFTTHDLAAIQREGGVHRLFTTFYTIGNIQFNQARESLGRTDWKAPASVARTLGDFALLSVMPAVMTVGLAHAVGKAKDSEDMLEGIAKEMLSEALGTMVGFRELQGMVHGASDYAGSAGTQFINLVYRLGAQIEQGKLDEGLIKALNAVGGTLLRYPTLQAERIVDGLAALDEGRSKNPAVIIFGAPPKKKGAK